MGKTRNFIGAVDIALAFTLSPAPIESAPVESAVEVELFKCTFSRGGRAVVVFVPGSFVDFFVNFLNATCEVGGPIPID